MPEDSVSPNSAQPTQQPSKPSIPEDNVSPNSTQQPSKPSWLVRLAGLLRRASHKLVVKLLLIALGSLFTRLATSVTPGGGDVVLMVLLIVFVMIFTFVLIDLPRSVNEKNERAFTKITEAIRSIDTEVCRQVNDIRGQITDARGQITDAVGSTHNKTHEVLQQMDERIGGTVRKMENVIRKFGTLNVSYIRNGQDDDPGYIKSLEMIEQAKRRIWIIGDFSPQYLPLTPPKERNRYLETIEAKVEQSVKDKSAKFNYTRIIQRDPDIFKRIKGSSDETLRQMDMIGDEQVYLHCYKVQNIKETQGHDYDNVKVSIRLSRPVPNCPSILLVDSKCMLFTIPCLDNRVGAGLQLITDGVLFFEFLDGGRQAAKDFESIFDRILDHTILLRKVEQPKKS